MERGRDAMPSSKLGAPPHPQYKFTGPLGAPLRGTKSGGITTVNGPSYSCTMKRMLHQVVVDDKDSEEWTETMGVEGQVNREEGRRAYDKYRRSLVGAYPHHDSATMIELARKFWECRTGK